jgi:hypothetical protein
LLMNAIIRGVHGPTSQDQRHCVETKEKFKKQHT